MKICFVGRVFNVDTPFATLPYDHSSIFYEKQDLIYQMSLCGFITYYFSSDRLVSRLWINAIFNKMSSLNISNILCKTVLPSIESLFSFELFFGGIRLYFELYLTFDKLFCDNLIRFNTQLSLFKFSTNREPISFFQCVLVTIKFSCTFNINRRRTLIVRSNELKVA